MDYLFQYSASLDHLLENREELGVVYVRVRMCVLVRVCVCVLWQTASVFHLFKETPFILFSLCHISTSLFSKFK